MDYERENSRPRSRVDPRGSGIPPAPSANGNPGWLSDVELAEIRRRLPLLYVEAVPVRVDGLGQVTEVGMLLRATPRARSRAPSSRAA